MVTGLRRRKCQEAGMGKGYFRLLPVRAGDGESEGAVG